jgi:uncharacterized protein with NAD-binding domain and iron-sulfur cluster
MAKQGSVKAKKTAKRASTRRLNVEPDSIETPRSRAEGPPKVAVFGAGIAGLTAAHELAERGFAVTVYEPQEETRSIEDLESRGGVSLEEEEVDLPVVRLGGMAATQYVHEDRLRAFPREGGAPEVEFPRKPPTGEHGFRFFPAYYLHMWDMLQRIPVYDGPLLTHARLTPRTVYDNVQRVITQAVTVNGQPSLILPREAPRSVAELQGALSSIRAMGFTTSDLSTFLGRLARYLVTSPERRSVELEEISTYDFLVGYDAETKTDRYQYSRAFESYVRSMPKILAAFDTHYGDARTNLTTFIQLNLALDRYDSKADGVLNGPTTEAWFDHWYRHLVRLGVTFTRGALSRVALVGDDLRVWVHIDGTEEPCDPELEYVVIATDSFTAERATEPLRDGQRVPLRSKDRQYARQVSTVLGLEGWATSKPPAHGPTQRSRPPDKRDPRLFSEMGWKGWDRFQTLSGVQFFFDTEFQVVRGHMYFSDSEWSLSAINQSGFWSDPPTLKDDGFVSVMSVDICDWNTKSSKLHKSARNCTRDEIAQEVWRQITAELARSAEPGTRIRQVPRPTWYSIDEFIVFTSDAGHPERPTQNLAPYLIPIVADWDNRPGGSPWNPHGYSTTLVPPDEMKADQERLRVWQAGHGGYEVHYDKLVFAGTWCRTFTRMTSMEAACESGRHAVNAILDHYLYVQSDRTDPRTEGGLDWTLPFDFVDQELSSPIRQPTPAGDYCFVFDCENREPADARPTRDLDADFLQLGLPHPWELLGIDYASAVASRVDPYGGAAPYDPGVLLVDQLRKWRSYFERLCADRPGERRRRKPGPWHTQEFGSPGPWLWWPYPAGYPTDEYDDDLAEDERRETLDDADLDEEGDHDAAPARARARDARPEETPDRADTPRDERADDEDDDADDEDGREVRIPGRHLVFRRPRSPGPFRPGEERDWLADRIRRRGRGNR